MKYRIKENSLIAKIAAAKLKSGSVAIVIGSTIHLHRVSEKDFLKNEKWVKHEMCHIQQFKKFGFFKFILKYLRESARVGYYNNRFEVEARKAESE
ncbi:MAG TPA: DUF4157 domain-containing protein [Hanamia sp.]|nr:DUF4157 domain-containing protein [Hanamia sp.]